MKIDGKVHKLVYLLRENGWNTTGSCGHEYEGLIIITCYAEQSGGTSDILLRLRNFLKDNGYKHFLIKRELRQWYGQIIEDILIVKILNSDWDARWK